MLAGHHGIWPVVPAVGISRSADLYHWPAVEKKKNTKTMISAADLSKYAKEKTKTKTSNQITGVHVTPSRCFKTPPSLAPRAGLASPVFHCLGRCLLSFSPSVHRDQPATHPSHQKRQAVE
ncbi:unnamed protein product [Rangifer tarandus platyrhynchus]|uniref:Uncharacterized protein n=2 Tax=Rangifer tarandus platyrhynchus TaxID=3082113 RepID=A0ABN9A1D5_RANTA|nr:unnamed protein product [Rangifer tarandus platyrhynchus]